MRILIANKFWYHRGGLERVMFDEIAWLEAAGHQTAHFSTRHPDNEPSPWAEFFVSYLELGSERELGAADKFRAAARMFANGEARRRFAALIGEFRPDVVHVHGIHRQLSPSILQAALAARVPVVQTLHDFHHVCPADSLLYRGVEPCQPRRCGTYWYGPGIAGRCVRGSVAESALSAAETTFSRARQVYERGVARFIAPSRFAVDVMREGSWVVPIDHVPNAVLVSAPDPAVATREPRFVVSGRVVAEKGVRVALEAARRCGTRVIVAGDGPARATLMREYPDAEFVGHIEPSEVGRLMASSTGALVPSLALENAPMSILEAMAAGVAVVASRIGGIPELVADGGTGLLVPAGDVDALAAAMSRLLGDPALAARMGAEGREAVTERFSAEAHLKGILNSYEAALSQRSDDAS